MLFRVSLKENIRENNSYIDSVDEFIGISDKDLKYIFLFHDIDSPYRKLKESIRSKMIWMALGYKDTSVRKQNQKLRMPKYLRAIEKFKSLSIDIEKESLDAYEAQIREINDFLNRKNKKASDLKLARDFMKELPKLIESRSTLSKLIAERYAGDVVNNEEEEDDISSSKTSLEKYLS